MIHVLVILLAFTGFAALALPMKRHRRDLIGRRLSDRERHLVRVGGSLLIVGSLVSAMALLDPAYGAVAWFGHLSIAAWAVMALLSWRARTR